MSYEEQANMPQPTEPHSVLQKVVLTDQQLKALSDQELQAQIDFFNEQEELENKQKELNRRAIKMGLLKLANQAPRCNHVKASGKPCRAPAFGGRLFCLYHGRALETREAPGIEVKVLEDRKTLQLTVKQIMEQVVRGRLEPEIASLLLRAVQIAKSTLKPKGNAGKRRPKSVRDQGERVQGDAEETSA